MAELETLNDLLERLPEHGEHEALVAFDAEERHWSYAELADLVSRLAAGFAERGIEVGTPVAVFAPNAPEWIIASLALVRRGAVPVPLDLRMGRRHLAHCLEDSDSRFALTTTATAPTIREHHPDPDSLKLIALDRERPRQSDIPWWRDLVAESGQEVEPAQPGDTAVLFYTSGTTGVPKGVPLSHRNLVDNVQGLLAEDIVDRRERALLPLPLHHVYPFTIGILVPLAQGSAIVLPAGISGPEIVRALHDGRVTLVMGVPRLYQTLLAAIRRRLGGEASVGGRLLDALVGGAAAVRNATGWNIGRPLFWPLRRRVAPELHLLVSGGSKLDAGLARRLEGLGWEVLTGYGLTETSPIVALNSRRHKNLASAGRPLRGMDVKIEPLEDKEGGEITVKGPSVFKGYHNLEKKTREAFTEDGYFRTGDIGAFDDDGFLFVTARVKETIVLPAGENIHPEDVEAAFLESEPIAEAAVLEHDERLALLVVPEREAFRDAGDDAAREAIEAEVRAISDRLPSYQRIADVVLTEESLPRTTLGKLRRHELPELLERARKGEPPPDEAAGLSAADERLLDEPRAGQAWEWLKDRFPDRRFTPNSSLFSDVGVDSLDWVDLSLELERELNVQLDETAISRIETVRDLLEAVAEADTAAPEGADRPSDQQATRLQAKGPLATALAQLLQRLNALVLRASCGLTVEGLEKLPADGPFILAPNHTSYLDAPALLAALPPELRARTYWAGSRRIMFKSAARRLFSRLGNVFPVDRSGARSALAAGKAVLEHGHVLAWFPEGRRSPDGQLQKLAPGIGELAAEAGVPLVPVHIAGTHAAWPVDRKLPRPAPLRVRFGSPLDADDPSLAEAETITAALHDAMAGLARDTRN
jgi:long-chain acyl-CoA synthetase